MGADLRTIATSRGDFILRPERPEDERFLFALFEANNIDILRKGGFPPELIENLIALQYRSQTRTYRSMFPDAIYSIVCWEGKDVGRYIEHDEGDFVYFVDFVLLPEYQAKGLGPALTKALMEEWAARGRGSRVKVMVNNEPSLKMCRRLGFTQGEPDEMAYVELRWRPPYLVGKAGLASASD
jgi:ribosomal protein S18 acetylase RimI-like enzyme